MKNNTKKLLLFLYSPDESENFSLSAHVIEGVLPNLTRAGRRSLLHLLKQQGLINDFSLNQVTQYFLTSTGKIALERELDVFRIPPDWKGDWQLLLFKQAPGFDPHFHFLRLQTLKNGGVAIGRAVYGFPHQCPEFLIELCRDRYQPFITLIAVESWILGDIKDAVMNQLAIHDLASAYSGISNQLSKLLIAKNDKKELNNTLKSKIYSLYDLFFANVCEDTGLVRFYVPKAPTFLQLLAAFQRASLE